MTLRYKVLGTILVQSILETSRALNSTVLDVFASSTTSSSACSRAKSLLSITSSCTSHFLVASLVLLAHRSAFLEGCLASQETLSSLDASLGYTRSETIETTKSFLAFKIFCCKRTSLCQMLLLLFDVRCNQLVLASGLNGLEEHLNVFNISDTSRFSNSAFSSDFFTLQFAFCVSVASSHASNFLSGTLFQTSGSKDHSFCGQFTFLNASLFNSNTASTSVRHFALCEGTRK